MTYIRSIVAALILISFLSSCEKEEDYPGTYTITARWKNDNSTGTMELTKNSMEFSQRPFINTVTGSVFLACAFDKKGNIEIPNSGNSSMTFQGNGKTDGNTIDLTIYQYDNTNNLSWEIKVTGRK